ncbi:MAG TPA: S28 family serine protease, partial [Kofleriaceae bacterium]|nr:S28 family serine protease [Kofleriaceae bacterium]
TGCGDNLKAPALTPEQLFVELRFLPGVTVEEVPTDQADFHYYVLHFTQPIDHDHPELGTFQQQVSLLHRNDVAPVPMIVNTSGYSDGWGAKRVELTELFDANQVSIEHRYYGDSRPVPTDWTKLTIQQMAADEHAIIAALHTIYGGAFLTTGASKGGMTALFHRRYYPDDVDGTVAYVAPMTFGAPDKRYPAQFNKIGSDECRDAVRTVARAMLAHREEMVELAAAQPGHDYNRVALGPSVEAAIAGLEWGFWQMWGAADCMTVPPPTASAADLFDYLDKISPVGDYDDDKVAYYEPYVYQTYTQLGYPDDSVAYLARDLVYTEADYLGELPTAEPPYDDNAMRDIQDWVDNDGSRLMLIYGEWDPWFAGRLALSDAADSETFILHEGTHKAQLRALEPFKRDPALAMLARWTGVDPVVQRPPLRRADDTPLVSDAEREAPRLPALPRRALGARR